MVVVYVQGGSENLPGWFLRRWYSLWYDLGLCISPLLQLIFHSFSPQYFMNKRWKKNTTTKTDKKTTGSYWCTFNHCIIINASNCFLQIIIGPKSDHCLALSVTESLLVLNFAQIVGFVKVVQLISLGCYTDLSKLLKLLHGFL